MFIKIGQEFQCLKNGTEFQCLKRKGPKFLYLKRQGENSHVYKNRTRTPMFGRIGPEIQY